MGAVLGNLSRNIWIGADSTHFMPVKLTGSQFSTRASAMVNAPNQPTGFLVVLKQAWNVQAKNPLYTGVDRVPPYHPDIEEGATALDKYVFGNFKNRDTNLIPTLDKAKELLREFAESRREYEIVYCELGPFEHAKSNRRFQRLGYDVAGVKGDYWSIVGDFSRSAWAEEFRQQLNANGLFDERTIAERYLCEYKRHDEPDNDLDFDVVYVARVTCGVCDTE